MDLAAVDADRALAEQRIVGRQFLHLRNHLGAVAQIAAHGFQRLEIVQHAGIYARHRHGGHRAALRLCRKPLRPGPRLVVHVPIKGFGERQALRRLQPERVHVIDEQQQRRKFLSAGHDAEFGGLLDRIGGIAAGVSETNDLGFRRLRLQQEG